MDTIAQIGLLAQGPGIEDWQNLLVLLVMGAIWLIGALAKAASARKSARQSDPTRQQSRPRETWQERLARKVEEIQRAAGANSTETARRLEQKTGLPAGGREPPRAPAPGGKITIRQGPRGESVMVYERPEPQPPPPVPPARPRQTSRPVTVTAGVSAPAPAPVPPKIASEAPAKPVLSRLPSVTLEPSEPSEPNTAKTELPPEESSGIEFPAIIDYGDPDALRKAILHYEILGKPLAFRDLLE